jgi:hypothetical protein
MLACGVARDRDSWKRTDSTSEAVPLALACRNCGGWQISPSRLHAKECHGQAVYSRALIKAKRWNIIESMIEDVMLIGAAVFAHWIMF